MSDIAETQSTFRLPTEDEKNKAKKAAAVVAKVISGSENLELCVRDNDHDELVDLPPSVGRLVLDLLMHVGNGQAVTLVPYGAELSTQEAADLLNVSRPYLVNLLEKGQIKFHKVGTHRRIMASDLIEYQDKRKAERKRDLDELARLAQEFEAE